MVFSLSVPRGTLEPDAAPAVLRFDVHSLSLFGGVGENFLVGFRLHSHTVCHIGLLSLFQRLAPLVISDVNVYKGLVFLKAAPLVQHIV